MKQNVVKIVLGLFIMAPGLAFSQPGKMTSAKKTAAKWVDKNSKSIQKASKTVWDYAEIALKEHKSAKLFIQELFTKFFFEKFLFFLRLAGNHSKEKKTANEPEDTFSHVFFATHSNV